MYLKKLFAFISTETNQLILLNSFININLKKPSHLKMLDFFI